jgi:hypothetical protein
MFYPTLFLLATTFASTQAATVKRQSSDDNGSCQALFKTCAAQVNPSLSNVFAIESCLFGASCFGGQRPVDDFLASLYSSLNGQGTTPTSVSLARVPTSVFNVISGGGNAITQQNFIDGYYGQLAASNGPYPISSSIVISYFDRLATWTGFCPGGPGIPYQNYADYYEFSASVSSSACGAATSSSTTSSTTPAPTTPVVSSDATCQKMFTQCVSEVDSAVDNIFSLKSCVLGATCFGGQRPVSGFVAAVYGQKNTGTPPTPLGETRLSSALFESISEDGGNTWTQQAFIDAWYSELSSVGGPFPPNPDLVISYFNRVLLWSGFCTGQGIPYMNTADYFQYSATVSGPTTQC